MSIYYFFFAVIVLWSLRHIFTTLKPSLVYQRTLARIADANRTSYLRFLSFFVNLRYLPSHFDHSHVLTAVFVESLLTALKDGLEKVVCWSGFFLQIKVRHSFNTRSEQKSFFLDYHCYITVVSLNHGLIAILKNVTWLKDGVSDVLFQLHFGLNLLRVIHFL